MAATPPFPVPVHAVIFDMDGLLIDSERPLRAAMIKASLAVDHPMDEALYASLIGRPYPAVHARLLDHFGSETTMDRFTELYRADIQDTFAAGITLMRGVLPLLDLLDAAGLPAMVATSTQRARAHHHLDKAGIGHRFRGVIGGDDVSQGKPHPDPYLKAAAALGVDPRHCVALEDSHNGIRSAHAAGTMPIMIPDLLPATAEIEALCHRVLPDLHAVRDLLAAHRPG